jgi:hypothetical protein
MNIQKLHKLVWTFRREMERYFPTPGRVDSVYFAFTEAAEALDARLRENPIYKRNTDKAHSVERELTQCAMMLLTAIPANYPQWVDVPTPYRWELPNLCAAVGALLNHPHDNMGLIRCVAAINTIVPLSETLPAELARMRAKHGPVQDDGPMSLNEVANESVIYPQQNERLVGVL